MAHHGDGGYGTRTQIAVMVVVGIATLVFSITLASLVVVRCDTVGLTQTTACSLNYDDDKAASGVFVLLLPTLVALVTGWVRPTRWWLGLAAGVLMNLAELALLWPR